MNYLLQQQDDEIDPCDPNYQQKLEKQRKKKLKAEKKAAAKKQQEEEEEMQKEEDKPLPVASEPQLPVERYWYEAKGPKGHSYYYHIYTNRK